MLPFTKSMKIYLFKDKGKVSLSIMVSESMVNTYDLPVDAFERLLDGWRNHDGVSIRTDKGSWHACHKTRTPRPENAPTSYVRLTVHVNGMDFNHRVGYEDMRTLETEYFFQKNNRMYWDS